MPPGLDEGIYYNIKISQNKKSPWMLNMKVDYGCKTGDHGSKK